MTTFNLDIYFPPNSEDKGSHSCGVKTLEISIREENLNGKYPSPIYARDLLLLLLLLLLVVVVVVYAQLRKRFVVVVDGVGGADGGSGGGAGDDDDAHLVLANMVCVDNRDFCPPR